MRCRPLCARQNLMGPKRRLPAGCLLAREVHETLFTKAHHPLPSSQKAASALKAEAALRQTTQEMCLLVVRAFHCYAFECKQTVSGSTSIWRLKQTRFKYHLSCWSMFGANFAHTLCSPWPKQTMSATQIERERETRIQN